MSFDLKHWWNLFFLLFKLLVRAPKFYNVKLKLGKQSTCVSETYFLLKTFSARYKEYIKYHEKIRKVFGLVFAGFLNFT